MISGTGLRFGTGSSLKSSDLNTMNDKINELVTVVNRLLQDKCNINIEILGGDTTGTMTLEEAIDRVPTERRVDGIILKFNQTDYGWVEYMYNGEGSWSNLNSWLRISYDTDELDGGNLDV